jgi:hypothetical protein
MPRARLVIAAAVGFAAAAASLLFAIPTPVGPAGASSTWVDPNVFLLQAPLALNVDFTTPGNIPLDAAGIGGNRIRRLPLDDRTIERQIEQDIATAINYERQMRGLYPYTYSENISAIHSRYASWLGAVHPDFGCPPGYGNVPTCHSVAPLWRGEDWLGRSLPEFLSPITGTAVGGPDSGAPANITRGAKNSGNYLHRASLMVYLGENPSAGEPLYLGIGIRCLPNGKTHNEFVVYRTSATKVNVHPDAALLPGDAGFAPFTPANFGRRCPQPSAPVVVNGGPTSLSVRVDQVFDSTAIRSQCQFQLPGPVIQAPFQTWKAHARIVGPGVDQTHTWDWLMPWNDADGALPRTHTVTGLPAGTYQVTVWQSNACETSMTTTRTVNVLPATSTTTPTTPPTSPPTSPPTTPTTTPMLPPRPSDGAATFHPVAPFRSNDTRTADGPMTAGETRVFTLRNAPADATAVTANVTAVNPASAGYLTVFPCSRRSEVSNVNFAARQTVPNQVTVGIANGQVCVYAPVRTDVVIDVSGWWRPAVGGSTPTPITPRRLADTRNREIGGAIGPGGAAVLPMPASVPADATAVSLNLTAVRPSAGTFIAAYPCGASRPNVSNMNLVAGDTRANMVTVALDATRQVCLYSDQGVVHLVADLTAVWTPASSTAGLVPLVPPERVLDTRRSNMSPLSTTVRQIVPPTPGVVFGNVTLTRVTQPVFAAVFPCGDGYQGTSNVNADLGETNANAVVVDASTGVCAIASSPVDAVFDIFAHLR